VLRDHNGHLSDGRRMAAGFAAGITEALLVVTPFEVVKIRLQQQKGLAYSQLKYHVSTRRSSQHQRQQQQQQKALWAPGGAAGGCVCHGDARISKSTHQQQQRQ
jgi:hypothetical protein